MLRNLVAAALLAWLGAPTIAAEANLLTNADFQQTTDAGLPQRWTVGKGQKVTVEKVADLPGVAQALRVDVVADGGTSYGQVYQSIKAKPNTLYVLEGKIKSTKKGLGFLSVKVVKDKHELQRIGLGQVRRALDDDHPGNRHRRGRRDPGALPLGAERPARLGRPDVLVRRPEADREGRGPAPARLEGRDRQGRRHQAGPGAATCR